jgi:hypothetical protein
MPRLLALIVLICSAAAAYADDVPLPRAKPVADEPATIFEPTDLLVEPSDCRSRLSSIADIEPLPRLVGPGACGGGDMVRLAAVRLRDDSRAGINPPAELRCEMAQAFAEFVRDDVAALFAPAKLAAVENFDAYDCRGRNRVAAAKISEHGKGNAIDVRAFRLAGTQVVSPVDVNVARELREKLRAAACARFTTILGPGSDGYHEGHIHFDLAARRGGYRICQWDVRDKAPEIAKVDVPLPPTRPAPSP